MNFIGGSSQNILRVDLSKGKIYNQELDETTFKMYLGGAGLGSKILYDEVPPGTAWDSPQNCLIFASGPLGASKVPGSGSFCVVTKGPLTNGATSSQANGYFGAFLKLSGFDAIAVTGVADRWVYLCINEDKAELMDADHLVGRDIWETEDIIRAALGKNEHGVSIFGIGPAGENLVKFAAIAGDRGHVAAHNGVGAVMGSKRLKAVAVIRGKKQVVIKEKERLATLSKKLVEIQKQYSPIYKWGTSFLFDGAAIGGWLPVKNLTTNIFHDYTRFVGENYRPRLEMKWSPCWACQAHHCHIVKVLEGPYSGYVAEEPEYEGMAAWSSGIGQTDVGAAIMLNNIVDRLGLDVNEAGWLVSFVMECYERSILTGQDLDGLEMNWGNVESTVALLHKIARREGIGNILAEGVMRAAQSIGGEALECAVFLEKGHAPRGHDHRARWAEILDCATSGTGTIETGPVPIDDRFDPRKVAENVAKAKVAPFMDSLVLCMLATGTFSSGAIGNPSLEMVIQMLNAVTGWDFDTDQAIKVSHRIANLLRVFNLRHGIGTEVEWPSARYGSIPSDGPCKGKNIMEHWQSMLDIYYQTMGWDRKTGKPFKQTLKELGLGHLIIDIYKN